MFFWSLLIKSRASLITWNDSSFQITYDILKLIYQFLRVKAILYAFQTRMKNENIVGNQSIEGEKTYRDVNHVMRIKWNTEGERGGGEDYKKQIFPSRIFNTKA